MSTALFLSTSKEFLSISSACIIAMLSSIFVSSCILYFWCKTFTVYIATLIFLYFFFNSFCISSSDSKSALRPVKRFTTSDLACSKFASLLFPQTNSICSLYFSRISLILVFISKKSSRFSIVHLHSSSHNIFSLRLFLISPSGGFFKSLMLFDISFSFII